MSIDRTQARCSFCGRRPPEVQRMIAGPGAAYICESCLHTCNEILQDPAPFSQRALELASRPPVVIPAPQELNLDAPGLVPREPLRTISLELEQKQLDMTLMLYQLQFYANRFELQYLWIRPPLTAGFAFVPRLIFFLKDNIGTQWAGDQGGTLQARPELASDPNHAVYQGQARFRPLPPSSARLLTVRAANPLGQFEDPAPTPWHFEIHL